MPRWKYVGTRTVTERAEVEISAETEDGARALGEHVVSEGGDWQRADESPISTDSVEKVGKFTKPTGGIWIEDWNYLIPIGGAKFE